MNVTGKNYAYKPLVEGTNDPTLFLTNAAATYYTVAANPQNTITIVRGLILCNTDSAAHTVRVHNVNAGDSAAAANALLYDVTLAAAGTEGSVLKICYNEGEWVMTAGMTIQALADASSKVTITLCGAEVSP
jgi:hypothetical protein